MYTGNICPRELYILKTTLTQKPKPNFPPKISFLLYFFYEFKSAKSSNLSVPFTINFSASPILPKGVSQKACSCLLDVILEK